MIVDVPVGHPEQRAVEVRSVATDRMARAEALPWPRSGPTYYTAERVISDEFYAVGELDLSGLQRPLLDAHSCPEADLRARRFVLKADRQPTGASTIAVGGRDRFG